MQSITSRPSRVRGGDILDVTIQDPLRAQEGCLERSGSIPNQAIHLDHDSDTGPAY